MLRGEKGAVESLAYQIILHKLLIQYWYKASERNRNHWRSQINNFQFQLNNELTTNLKNHSSDRLEKIFLKAKKEQN